jgi:hypothetical protein
MEIMELYGWQKEIVKAEGNVGVKGPRQSGKSEAVAKQIEERAKKYPKSISLITSPSERQENFLFEKLKRNLGEFYKYKKRPTLKMLVLANGSIIYKFPTGPTGVYVEGLSSVDFLYIDESKAMAERGFDALLPMLAEPRSRGLGWVTMLSSTHGHVNQTFKNIFKEGSGWKLFNITSKDCPHLTPEFLQGEKERLGELRYRAIWEGEFIDFEQKYFSKELLDKLFVLKSWTLRENWSQYKTYFLGIDPARTGKCGAGFVVIEVERGRGKVIYAELLHGNSMVELMKKAEQLHHMFKFRRIYIDTGGVGAGLYDFLHEKYPILVKDLNNASRGEGGKILKEDLYSNVLRLIETGKLESVNDLKLRESMDNIEWDGEKITGKNTDLAEALVRACWGMREKNYEPKII